MTYTQQMNSQYRNVLKCIIWSNQCMPFYIWSITVQAIITLYEYIIALDEEYCPL